MSTEVDQTVVYMDRKRTERNHPAVSDYSLQRVLYQRSGRESTRMANTSSAPDTPRQR